jgi:hypothetical protein
VDRRRERRTQRKLQARLSDFETECRAVEIGERLARPIAAEIVRQRQAEVDAYAVAAYNRAAARLQDRRDRLDSLSDGLRDRRAEVRRRERALAQREAELATPTVMATVTAPVPTPPAEATTAAPEARCLREGCPRPPADGARFCAEHRWS